MKRIWDRRDTAALAAAVARHPATIGRALDERDRAVVVDIKTGEVLA